jgi:hypothetical protein
MTYLSILAVIPLLLVVATPSLLKYSEAINESMGDTLHRGGLLQGLVCGDHLCNEHKTETAVSADSVVRDSPILHDHLPQIEIITVNNFKGQEPNAYIVIMTVTAGKQNIENISIKITSDTEATNSNIGGLFASDSTDLVIYIHAIDPGSVVASVTGYQLNT